MKKSVIYLTCLIALYACNAPNDGFNSEDVNEVKHEVQNVTPPPISSYGFDQLGCIVSLPDYQFNNPETGYKYTNDFYTNININFETQLIELGQHRFPVSVYTVEVQTAKDTEKEFFTLVPSFWGCPRTIEEIEKIHAEFYPNTKLVYDTASVADYAKSILGENYPQ